MLMMVVVTMVVVMVMEVVTSMSSGDGMGSLPPASGGLPWAVVGAG